MKTKKEILKSHFEKEMRKLGLASCEFEEGEENDGRQWIYDAMDEYVLQVEEYNREKNNEPYFGWCDVKGCSNEACGGGLSWRETGYWKTCYKHSDMFRSGKPQPPMKKKSIEREKTRQPDGTLP